MAIARYSITVDGETALLGSAGELIVALDVLQGQHDREVLQQLRPYLAEIVAGPEDLHAVLRVLAPDDQAFLVDALGERLPRIVGRAGALRDILATLADQQVEEHMLDTLGAAGLQSLILSAEDLAGVLEWIYGQSDRLVLRLLGAPFLRRLIQNGSELSLVLHAIDHAAQEELVNTLGWEEVQALVHDLDDLAHLLRALPGRLGARFLARLTRERLWDLVRNEHGLRTLRRFLEKDEAAVVDEILGGSHAE